MPQDQVPQKILLVLQLRTAVRNLLSVLRLRQLCSHSFRTAPTILILFLYLVLPLYRWSKRRRGYWRWRSGCLRQNSPLSSQWGSIRTYTTSWQCGERSATTTIRPCSPPSSKLSPSPLNPSNSSCASSRKQTYSPSLAPVKAYIGTTLHT